jgi:hypothetical protein
MKGPYQYTFATGNVGTLTVGGITNCFVNPCVKNPDRTEPITWTVDSGNVVHIVDTKQAPGIDANFAINGDNLTLTILSNGGVYVYQRSK